MQCSPLSDAYLFICCFIKLTSSDCVGLPRPNVRVASPHSHLVLIWTAVNNREICERTPMTVVVLKQSFAFDFRPPLPAGRPRAASFSGPSLPLYITKNRTTSNGEIRARMFCSRSKAWASSRPSYKTYSRRGREHGPVRVGLFNLKGEELTAPRF